jgi:nucleoside-diphosphate-sugar epimerase
MMNEEAPTQLPAAIQGSSRGKLGRPRLLIIGCGDIGARILARVADRFRVIAVTTSQARAPQLRALGAVPLVIDLDRARAARRLRPLAEHVIDLVPTPDSGVRDPRSRALAVAFASVMRHDRARSGAHSRSHRPAAARSAVHSLSNRPAASHRAEDTPSRRLAAERGALHIQAQRPAAARGALRFVYASTSGVYGDAAGAWLDETARPRPRNERAQRRLDAEQVLRAACHARVLRVPGIYAADRLPLERLRQQLPALADADDVYTNHIHADDLARIALAALLRGRPKRVYNAVDDTQLKMGAYFDLVAQAHGLPHPPRLPRAQMQAAVTPAMYSFMTESRRLRNGRMKNELRVRLHWPTVEMALRNRPKAAADNADNFGSNPIET